MDAAAIQAEKDRLTLWHQQQTALLDQNVHNAQARVTQAQAALDAAQKYLADTQKTAEAEKVRIGKHLDTQTASLDRYIAALKKPIPWPPR